MIQTPQTTPDIKDHQVKMKYEEEDLKTCSFPCAAILLPSQEVAGKKNPLLKPSISSSGSHPLQPCCPLLAPLKYTCSII